MKEDINDNLELQLADELADKGNAAFLSYAWKLDKLSEDEIGITEEEKRSRHEENGDENPYSTDEFANKYGAYEHDLELASKYYFQALGKYEKILGKDHIKTAEMYLCCAETIMQEEFYNKDYALELLQAALTVFQRDNSHEIECEKIHAYLDALHK